MKLEDMKRIAAARTKGEWGYCYDGSSTFSIGQKQDPQFPQICSIYSRDIDPPNAEFIAMAANNWDKMMAIVDAAKEVEKGFMGCLSDGFFTGLVPPEYDRLSIALKALDENT